MASSIANPTLALLYVLFELVGMDLLGLIYFVLSILRTHFSARSELSQHRPCWILYFDLATRIYPALSTWV